MKTKYRIILTIIPILSLSIISMIALAYAEGVYRDPKGQLNNPFTLVCNSGILSDKNVSISEDGEYNWMLVKDQSFQLEANLITVQNSSIRIFLYSWSNQQIIKEGILHASTDKIEWSIEIPHAGHYQLEIVNYVGISVIVKLYVIAGHTNSLGILGCLNPGDLFRND